MIILVPTPCASSSGAIWVVGHRWKKTSTCFAAAGGSRYGWTCQARLVADPGLDRTRRVTQHRRAILPGIISPPNVENPHDWFGGKTRRGTGQSNPGGIVILPPSFDQLKFDRHVFRALRYRCLYPSEIMARFPESQAPGRHPLGGTTPPPAWPSVMNSSASISTAALVVVQRLCHCNDTRLDSFQVAGSERMS